MFGKKFWGIVAVFFSFILMNAIFATADSLNDLYDTDLFEGTYKAAYNQFFGYQEAGNCCIELDNGAHCQDVPFNYTECKGDIIPSSCRYVSECGLGCCFDETEGTCTPNSPQKSCEEDRGTFEPDAYCSYQKCEKGCCVLGTSTLFTTDRHCERLSFLEGVGKDFRQVESEMICVGMNYDVPQGACTFDSGHCVFTNEQICDDQGGVFNEGFLCSHPSLESGCQRQSSISCVEGLDEIYWFDSCGNRENIYSSDKMTSWNAGKVLLKEQSCGAGYVNVGDRDCGNCNYNLGSFCSETLANEVHVRDGNYVCEPLDCPASKETLDVARVNGESWCVYDTFVGGGQDPVGSRHVKMICSNGEVKSEPCADYRNELCAETTTTTDTGRQINAATCRINRWDNCIGINGIDNENQMEQECDEEIDCYWRKVEYGDTPGFNFCSPKYPPGFDIAYGSSTASGSLCSMADLTCDVTFMCDDCVANCDCLEASNTESWNDYCRSLGDCGAHINYVGELTTAGYKIKEGSKVTDAYLAGLEDYSDPVEGQYIETGDVNGTSYYNAMHAGRNNDYTNGASGSGAGESQGGGAGMMGAIGGLMTTIGMTMGMSGSTAWGAVTGMTQGVATAAGTGAGSLGGIGGTGILAGVGWLPIVGWVIAAIGIILTLFSAMGGGGLGGEQCTPTIKTVQFSCMQWQPPYGEDDCEKCNGDTLIPCTEYRCSSLGAACELLDGNYLNSSSSNPRCVGLGEDDGKAPILMTPINLNLGSDIEINGVRIGDVSSIFDELSKVRIEKRDNRFDIKGETEDCLNPSSLVAFQLQTNEPAECRMSFFEDTSFDNMTAEFLEANSFTEEHTFLTIAPSLQAMNFTDSKIDMLMYVKCVDRYGDVNDESYVLNFCLEKIKDVTKPKVMYTFPLQDGYFQYGRNETKIYVSTNEPADCRMSLSNVNYDNMGITMDCKNEYSDLTILGWECSQDVGDLGAQNRIYVRCKDQPWLKGTADSANRNEMDESYELRFSASPAELEISDISPSGDIIAAVEPFAVSLEVDTSKGVENGRATCYYSFTKEEADIEFYETRNKNRHKQSFATMQEGEYTIYIKCEDVAKNIAYGKAEFDLKLDTTAPEVVRMYNSGNRLTVITNEDAECYYRTDRCNFNFETNGTMPMTTGFSTIHGADWNPALTYRIKCADVYGNTNSGCAIVAKPVQESVK